MRSSPLLPPVTRAIFGPVATAFVARTSRIAKPPADVKMEDDLTAAMKSDTYCLMRGGASKPTSWVIDDSHAGKQKETTL